MLTFKFPKFIHVILYSRRRIYGGRGWRLVFECKIGYIFGGHILKGGILILRDFTVNYFAKLSVSFEKYRGSTIIRDDITYQFV